MADLAGLATRGPPRARGAGVSVANGRNANERLRALWSREQEELLAATGEWRSLNYTITPDGPLHPRASSLSTIERTGTHMPLVCIHQTLGKRRYGAAVVKSLAGEENGDIMSGGEH